MRAIRAYKVSIPYRFNERQRNIVLSGVIVWFQFLIGSMKVTTSSGSTSVNFKFQFLIGSMKVGNVGIDCTARKFQFLIGSMKVQSLKL